MRVENFPKLSDLPPQIEFKFVRTFSDLLTERSIEKPRHGKPRGRAGRGDLVSFNSTSILAYKRANDLTLDKLSEITGISSPSLSRITNGRLSRITKNTYSKLEAAGLI